MSRDTVIIALFNQLPGSDQTIIVEHKQKHMEAVTDEESALY